MQRSGATERDQRAGAQVLPALDGMHARRVRHVLVHHLADTECRMLGCEVQRSCDPLGGRALGSSDIKRDLAAGEGRRIDTPKNHIGIGHGRFFAAAAVAHRPRLRPGAVWTDDDPPERVNARDRTAAGADLDHFDYRNAQRQSAALEEAVDPRHLEGARGLRLRLVDEADLRGRPAHVEGYDLIEPVLTRDASGEDRAARGPGFDQSDRKANGGLGGRDPAARGHQQEGTVKAGAHELAGELHQIAPDQRLEIGVRARGREALVFAHLRRDVAG